EADNVTDILARVVMKDPDLSRVPERIHKLLKRCLDRDPRERLRDVGEARFLLVEEPKFKAVEVPRPRRRWLSPALAAVFGVATLALGYVSYQHYTEEAPVSKFSLLAPEKTFSNAAAIPAISPDGRRVAFMPSVDGQTNLWIRDLDGLNARMLPGTTGGSFPFWSPDSGWAGFFADNKLKKIDVTGARRSLSAMHRKASAAPGTRTA